MMKTSHTSRLSSSRSTLSCFLATSLLFLGSATIAAAQETAAAPAASVSTGSWYVVTGRNVNIRCAPNVSRSYSVGRLQKEDRVLVVDETNGWATIQTTGPSFNEVFGLIRADAQVKEDGSTVEILTATPLMAPNVAAKNDPARSWHTFATIAPGTTFSVQAAFDDDQGQRHLLVGLPDTSHVFVNLAFLKQVESATPVAEPKSEPKAEPTEEPTPTLTEESTPEETDEVVENLENDTAEIETPEPTETTDENFEENGDGSEEAQEVDPLESVTLELAESAWATLKREGGLDDEIEALQLLYTVIATREDAPADEKHIAELRIRQLELKREVQIRLQRLQAMMEDNTVDRDRMKNAQVLIDARAAYDAVGRLNASRVYDGKRLPMLYRLSSPSGGRTIGYIRPNEQVDLLPMLGRLVGIVGGKNFDAGYRLLIVSPKRIDILTASVTE